MGSPSEALLCHAGGQGDRVMEAVAKGAASAWPFQLCQWSVGSQHFDYKLPASNG